jgi:hypothetical protein
MNKKMLCMLLLMSSLALSVSACDIQPGAVSSPVDTQMGGQPASKGDSTQEISVEINTESAVAVEPVGETIEDGAPEDLPSLEEREAMLDGVNQGGPVLEENGQAPVQGPVPGTESGPADDAIPDLEEREAILDGVNQGGPVLEEDGQAPVQGPAPGTESGSAGDTIPDILSRFVTALVDWFRGLFP